MMNIGWREFSKYCSVCGVAYGMYGTFRLVAQQNRGFIIRKPGESWFAREGVDHSKKALDNGLVLHAWGELSTPEILQSLVAAVNLGEHPWFCMKCGKRMCDSCGSALKLPPGSDVLRDDFSIIHVPIFPIPYRCSNLLCSGS
jgi:hypothetical protein